MQKFVTTKHSKSKSNEPTTSGSTPNPRRVSFNHHSVRGVLTINVEDADVSGKLASFDANNNSRNSSNIGTYPQLITTTRTGLDQISFITTTDDQSYSPEYATVQPMTFDTASISSQFPSPPAEEMEENVIEMMSYSSTPEIVVVAPASQQEMEQYMLEDIGIQTDPNDHVSTNGPPRGFSSNDIQVCLERCKAELKAELTATHKPVRLSYDFRFHWYLLIALLVTFIVWAVIFFPVLISTNTAKRKSWTQYIG